MLMEYDITEYRNMFIPEELRCLMGKISREEMQYKITLQNAKDRYILMKGKPITFVKKVVR